MFKPLWTKEVPDMGLTAHMYEHEITKTPLLWLQNEDSNKLFAINFTTPPPDSTGVAHILEHSVLNGSKKYSVKEPFVELLKSSLYTYLNAWTSSDHTVYPVSSQNDADLHNLISVYLDAVFNPLLTEKTFAQEGWHLEAKNDETIKYKGVVFNEMKGAMADPDSVIWDYTTQELFPDTLYKYNSGGEPEDIPNLTYEQFRAFYEKYYHPSNAKIILYGDLNFDEYAAQINEGIKDFSYQKPTSVLATQATFATQKTIEKKYENPEGKGISILSWGLPATVTAEESWALDILDFILTSTEAAPLKRALLESELGEDPVLDGFCFSLSQIMFTVGLKGVKEENLKKVEPLILKTIEQLSHNIPKNLIEAAFNRTLFSLRDLEEKNPISFARRAITPWLYGRDPLEFMQFEDHFQTIQDKITAGEPYFENLLTKYLLQNPHRVTLQIHGQKDFLLEKEKKETESLTKIEQHLTTPERIDLARKTEALHHWQNDPNTQEALKTIPQLHLADLAKKNEIIPSHVEEADGVIIHHTPLPTQGISTANILLDLSHLTVDDLPFLSVYLTCLNKMGTKSHTFDELATLKATYTGSLGAGLLTPTHFITHEPLISLNFGVRMLEEKVDKAMDLLREIIHDIDLSDKKRMANLLKKDLSRMEQNLISSGHYYAYNYALSSISPSGALDERINGLSYYTFLKELLSAEKEIENLPEKLKRLHQLIISQQEKLILHLNSDRPERTKERLLDVALSLPRNNTYRKTLNIPLNAKQEMAFIVPTSINFVAQVASVAQTDYSRHGSQSVVLNALNMNYLWQTVRAQGGAYGAHAYLGTEEKTYGASSYRDPNIQETINAFNDISSWLKSYDESSEELEKLIIGTVGSIDNSALTPGAKGWQSFICFLTGYSDEEQQKWRDQVLATTKDDFKRFADVLSQVNDNDKLNVIVGNKEKILTYARENPEVKVVELLKTTIHGESLDD